MLVFHLCFGLFFFGTPQPAITYHPLRTPMAQTSHSFRVTRVAVRSWDLGPQLEA